MKEALMIAGMALGLVTITRVMAVAAEETGAGPETGALPGEGAGTLWAIVKPAEPYVLPDGSTRIEVKKESIYLGRAGHTGTVHVHLGESVLEVVPRTVIAAGGYRFEFSKAPEFKLGHVREEDMIFTVVEECTLTVRSTRQEPPEVPLKELADTVEMACFHNMPSRQIYTLRGDGAHFVSFKPTTVEVSRFHPDPELGARVKMDVVNNFGARSITLNYKKKTEVTIGHETISLESFGYDHQARKLKVRIVTVPRAASAKATILLYGATP